MKRSYDTAILIYELIAGGLDSGRGTEILALLNRVHRNVPGSKEDFLYVLVTLLVVPLRWTRSHAWRPPTSAELAAAARFFSGLGLRMNITAMPSSYAEAEAFFDRYEAARVAPSPAGRRLMGATVQVFQSRLPAPLRPLARPIISTMLDDDRLTDALGLPRATRATRAALKAGLALRNAVHRRRPLTTQPRSSPVQQVRPSTPAGTPWTRSARSTSRAPLPASRDPDSDLDRGFGAFSRQERGKPSDPRSGGSKGFAVELRRFELLTSSMRTKRSTN